MPSGARNRRPGRRFLAPLGMTLPRLALGWRVLGLALLALVGIACSGGASGAAPRALISDDFANNINRWPVDNVHTFFEPGRYRIKSFDDRAFLTTLGGSVADLTLETELQRLDGPTDIF